MIKLDRVSIRAGDFELSDLSFSVPAGAYAVLRGRTGTGKTTLLEAVAGLATVRAGRIVLDGVDVTRFKPALRGVGYVPQDGCLFQSMTVADHLSYALDIRREERRVIRRRVAELADMLSIGHLLHRLPQGLSGGERQRVALGRALSFRPRILLLDEPLSALDEQTRRQMYELLERLCRNAKATTLHVTHNPEDAERLADCSFHLENGRLVT